MTDDLTMTSMSTNKLTMQTFWQLHLDVSATRLARQFNVHAKKGKVSITVCRRTHSMFIGELLLYIQLVIKLSVIYWIYVPTISGSKHQENVFSTFSSCFDFLSSIYCRRRHSIFAGECILYIEVIIRSSVIYLHCFLNWVLYMY